MMKFTIQEDTDEINEYIRTAYSRIQDSSLVHKPEFDDEMALLIAKDVVAALRRQKEFLDNPLLEKDE